MAGLECMVRLEILIDHLFVCLFVSLSYFSCRLMAGQHSVCSAQIIPCDCERVGFAVLLCTIAVGLVKDYYIDGQNTQLILFEKMTTEGGKKAPKLHPAGGFFEP